MRLTGTEAGSPPYWTKLEAHQGLWPEVYIELETEDGEEQSSSVESGE